MILVLAFTLGPSRTLHQQEYAEAKLRFKRFIDDSRQLHNSMKSSKSSGNVKNLKHQQKELKHVEIRKMDYKMMKMR